MAKTITATLGELVTAEPALRRVLAVALDAKTRYHAVKLARLVGVETTHFAEERERIIQELGQARPATADEQSRGITCEVTAVTPANHAAYVKRINELLAVSVAIGWGAMTTAMLEPYPAVTGLDCLELGPLYELDPVAAVKPEEPVTT